MVCASLTCMRIFMVFAYHWKPLHRQEDVMAWEGKNISEEKWDSDIWSC